MKQRRRLILGVIAFGWLMTGKANSFGATQTEEPKAWFETLKFRLVGPWIGGRVSRVTGVPGDPLTWYFAAAQGGVWKSTDGGKSFYPIFDDQPASSLGAIAVAPSDPNVIYVGAGEANIRGNVAKGTGIFRSLDAGKTWEHVWKGKGQIGTLVVHPIRAEVAYAAVLGSPFGPGPERGVYRTTDGGKSWQRVLFVDENTGACDVEMDPKNPRKLFAGTWQARRSPWNLTSGGPGSGLWVSQDGGDTWKRLEGNGLPSGPWGKVGVRVAPSDPSRVYALIEAKEGGLFRSDDGGEHWRRVNDHRALRQRAWYYTVLTVDPRNPDVVWFPQVQLLKSLDGGKSIVSVSGTSHGDHHDLWIDPTDPRRMIVGHDGGVDLSVDGGKTWWAPKLPLAQFYNLDVDDRLPYHVGGTIQDQGTASGPSNSLKEGGIGLFEWTYAGGGEAGDFAYHQGEPGVVYAGEYGGYLSYYEEKTSQARMISVYPTNPSGWPAKELRHRFQWTAPILTSRHDPNVLYHGAERLFRSRDRGATWEAVSPDLTRNDRTKQEWSGGPITGDNTGVEIFGTIFSLAESPLVPGLLWVGTDDGLVYVSEDNAHSWRNVTPPGVPEWATVESIEPSPHDPDTAYVVLHRYRLDDDRPYLFRTRNRGKSWESLASGLPQDLPLWVLREDPERKNLLFLGHEHGVSFSPDGGKTWHRLRLNLPTVAVVDLEVRHGDLILATRGRSIWILDDITPLREWKPELAEKEVYLFPPRAAVRWRLGTTWGSSLEGRGENPPYGALLTYWLGRDAEEVVLEVFDEAGKPIRRLDSRVRPAPYPPDDPDEPTPEPKPDLEKSRGLHRVAWDLRTEGARRLERAKIDLGNPHRGVLVPPGRYRLVLTAGKDRAETWVEVKPDPRSPVDAAGMAENYRFAIELRDAISRVVDRIEEIRWLEPQVKEFAERVEKLGGHEALVRSLSELREELRRLERELHSPDAQVTYDILAWTGGAKIHSILSLVYDWGINASDHPPTQGMREVMAEELKKLEAVEARLRGIWEKDLPRLEADLEAAGLPHLLPAPSPPPRL